MRYTYKVRELTPETEGVVDVGEAKQMEAMSLKKLRRKLDAKKTVSCRIQKQEK